MANAKPVLRKARPVLRGYLYGVEAAAAYLGISRGTFRLWRDDPEMAHAELLKPRIIRGDSYYCIQKLDKFMDPANNPPGAATISHFASSEQ